MVYRRGEAPPDVAQRVQSALADENSQVRGWLRGVEKCVDSTFDFPRSFSQLRRKLLVDFIQEKHRDGTLTAQEVDIVLAAGTMESSSPGTALLSMVRMFDKLLDLHPQLAEQTIWLKSGRAR
jgi:hypothetical protein